MSNWPEWTSPDGRIRLINADCLEVPEMESDAVVTDPPYPNTMEQEYSYRKDGIDFLAEMPCKQFIFWTPSAPFPLSWDGKRIWDKRVGTQTQFEEIYERNSSSGYLIHRAYSMGCFSSVGAQMTRDVITGHPSQKPVKLLMELVNECGETILDPFAGSCTTAIACIRTDRRCIAIEKEPKYFQIGIERCQREYERTALLDKAGAFA